jgi:hypothetical protein
MAALVERRNGLKPLSFKQQRPVILLGIQSTDDFGLELKKTRLAGTL